MITECSLCRLNYCNDLAEDKRYMAAKKVKSNQAFLTGNQLPKQPLYKGDQVTTNFFPKERNQTRKVTRCYPSITSESKWMVDTEDHKGKILQALDSNWYRLIEKSRD